MRTSPRADAAVSREPKGSPCGCRRGASGAQPSTAREAAFQALPGSCSRWRSRRWRSTRTSTPSAAAGATRCATPALETLAGVLPSAAPAGCATARRCSTASRSARSSSRSPGRRRPSAWSASAPRSCSRRTRRAPCRRRTSRRPDDRRAPRGQRVPRQRPRRGPRRRGVVLVLRADAADADDRPRRGPPRDRAAAPEGRHRDGRRHRRRPALRAHAAASSPPAAIVLLSDGKETTGTNSLEAAVRARRPRAGLHRRPRHADGLHRGQAQAATRRQAVPPDASTLREIARRSGGRFFAAPDAKDLQTVYERLGSSVVKVPERQQPGFAGGALALILVGGALSFSRRDACRSGPRRLWPPITFTRSRRRARPCGWRSHRGRRAAAARRRGRHLGGDADDLREGHGRHRSLRRLPEGDVRLDDPREAFFRIGEADIRDACDILSPVFERTGGGTATSPSSSPTASSSVEMAKRLRDEIAKDNVLIKVPSEAGVKAFEELTAAGVSVNVTLLFAVPRYEQIASTCAVERRVRCASLSLRPSRASSSRASTARSTPPSRRTPPRRQGAERQARLRELPEDLFRRAGRRSRRRAATSSCRVHRHEEPRVPRHALRRQPDRPVHGQHHASTPPSRPRATTPRRAARSTRTSTPPTRSSTSCARSASRSTTSSASCSSRTASPRSRSRSTP